MRIETRTSQNSIQTSPEFKKSQKVPTLNRVIFMANMSNWEEEKDKYLKLEAEAKQNKKCIRIEKIPTWKRLCESEILPDPIFMKENCALDISKNEILSEKISIFEGDITLLAIDAIVNSTNSSLSPTEGISGTIHNIAGPSLQAECETLAPCKTGQAIITGGYKLPCRYVIHTVGPQGEFIEKLKKCYRESLELLISKGLRTIAFPCISTGSNGFPNLSAAHAAAYQVRKYLEDKSENVDRVIFCLYVDKDRKAYKGILQTYFPLSH